MIAPGATIGILGGGQLGRMLALFDVLGDPGKLEIVIMQLVQVVERGERAQMSKRRGEFVTLDELVGDIGVDAARFFLLQRSPDTPLDLDLDLARERSNENPVYYVQYVAARTASGGRNAAEVGLTRGDDRRPELLAHEKEHELLKALGEFPAIVATAAELREPHRVARYLEDLAGAYHRFYDQCRILPLGDEEIGDLHRARLWLNDATRVVIANGLGLLGVSAPERM